MKKQKKLIAIAVTVLLTACGGGETSDGIASGGSEPPQTRPDAGGREHLQLHKSSYVSGDLIDLSEAGAGILSATLKFASGETVDSLLLPDKTRLLVPALPAALRGQSVRLEILTTAGQKVSQPVTVTAHPTDGASPGLPTLVFIGAAIEQLDQNIKEYQALMGDTSSPELDEINKLRKMLLETLSAVELARLGGSTLLASSSDGQDIRLSPTDLDMLDQSFLVLYKIATGTTIKTTAHGAPNTLVNAKALQLSDPADRAWAANIKLDAAVDRLVNYTGATTTVISSIAIVAGTLGLVSASPIIAVSTSAFILANLVGGALKVAAGSGTGSAEGLNTLENVKNLGQVAAEQLAGPAARLLPIAKGEYWSTLNEVSLVWLQEKVIEKIDKRVEAVGGISLSSPPGATSTANSRITGTWLGTIASLRVTRGSCDPGRPTFEQITTQMLQTSGTTVFWNSFLNSQAPIEMERQPNDPLLFRGRYQTTEQGSVSARFSNGYSKAVIEAVASLPMCDVLVQYEFAKR